MNKILGCIALLLFFSACKEKETPEPEKELSVVERIAQANGIQHLDEVVALQYTFNVKVNDSLRTSRKWTWNPKTGQVTLNSEDTTLTYNTKTGAKQHPQVDQKFINDQYWLLFPFHLVWDEMTYEHNERAVAPISGDTLQRVIVQYPQDAGYTPGDVYEVYFGDDYIIKEWVYRSGGSKKNPFAATWEDYEDHNGLIISTSHGNKNKTFQLFFTDINISKEVN